MTEEADSNESRILENPIVEAEATSCDDIPDFAVLCSFLDRFGSQLGIACSIKEVQFMLELQGNVSEQLIDIHVKLLRKILSGANKVRFDKHLSRFCESFLTPYNFSLVVCLQNEGYAKLDLASKVHILKGLLELQFDFNTKFKQIVNDKTPEELRLLPLGRDVDGLVYWLQVDEDLNVRLFSENLDDEHSFKLLHKTKEELSEFIESLKKLKSEKFKGDNTPKRPMINSAKEGLDSTNADIKPDCAQPSEIKQEASDLPEERDEKPVVKEELEKKEFVEDLCIRQNENSRSSGENQPAVKTKLENEAHCQPIKTEAAPTVGKPEAAHSASSKEVPEGIDTAATDLSLPHLPTPPHEQEQRLPAPPQSAVHSPPVPHKKSNDDDRTDHAAEDLRTGKKDEDDQEGDDEDSAEDSKTKTAERGSSALSFKPEDSENANSERVESARSENEVEPPQELAESDRVEPENKSEIEAQDEKETPDETKEIEDESSDDDNKDDDQRQKNLAQTGPEQETAEADAEKVETSEKHATEQLEAEAEKSQMQEEPAAEEVDAESVQGKKRGRGRPKKAQGKEKLAEATKVKKATIPRGRKGRIAEDEDEDYEGYSASRKTEQQQQQQTSEAKDDEDRDCEEDDQPKKPKKLSREARALLAEAERLRKAEEDAEEDAEVAGRPRRSCRMRREVEKYVIPDDDAPKKKRKSKADQEEEKEVVFVTGKNAKAARNAAKEMLKAQKLAHKELMRKLKGKKKRGRKGESDDDELDSMDGLLYGEDEDEDEEDALKFDDNDEDEFACDEEIADGEFTFEEIKKARTAKKADETKAVVDDEPCRRCNKSDHPEFILLCDSCDAGYHMNCLKPALMVIPLGNWYCPPCEHDALITALKDKLSFIEGEWEKRQKEITRKQRLAFVSINIGSVLPSTKRETAKKSYADEEDFEDDESEISEVGSSDDEEDVSDDSSGQPRRRRAARRGDAIREKMQEYDKIMREAIEDEDEEERPRSSPARKRSGKDMSNILPESDEEGATKNTKRRRKSKLSDLNAADSEEDSDDSEFQASDYSDMEVNKRKPKKGRRSKFASDDNDEEDSDAGSDASWGRTNIRSAKRSAARRKNPLAREKSSKKGGSTWDDWDSEASQSFKVSSDDSGDFCKPRKRQTVNYAESSEEEDEKPRASTRRKKPSDDEVSIDEEEEEEEDDDDDDDDDDEETPEEDASNEEDRSASGGDDDDDEDEDDDDDDGFDSDAVARKKRKLAKKLKGKKDKDVKDSRAKGRKRKKGDSKKRSSSAKKASEKKRKKKKDLSDEDEDSEDGSDTWAPKKKRQSQKVRKNEDEDDFEDEEEEAEDRATPRRNGRADASKPRSKVVESDDEDEEEEEEEEDAPKAWPPLPSHLMVNMNKPKKQPEAAGPAEAPKLSEAVQLPVQASPPARSPETSVPPPPQQPTASRTPTAVYPQAAATIALAAPVIPAVVIPAVVPAVVTAAVVPTVAPVAASGVLPVISPSLAIAAHPMAAAHNGLRSVYSTPAGLVQYPSTTTGQVSEEMSQYYQSQGYAYPAQYGYAPHHQPTHMPGYPASAYSSSPYPHESFSEWGPSGPQAQVVASAVEEKPSENFSISNILQQGGDTNEEIDSVTSIGNLMGK